MPQRFQHKDTRLLCIWNDVRNSRPGCTETAGANGPWDGPHPVGNHILNCTHCSMYCTRGEIQMINGYYGGTIPQDEISYGLRVPGGAASPETGLGHGVGAWASQNNAYSWALDSLAWVNEVILNPTAFVPFATLKGQIDAGRPMLAALDVPRHSVVVDGYFDNADPAKRWIHIADPWPNQTSWYRLRQFRFVRYYTVPAAGAITGRVTRPTVSQDGDSDGIMTFDEGQPRAFQSLANHADTDGDSLGDKQEIRDYTFHRNDHLGHPDTTLALADIDGDGLRSENDCDSDSGGDLDGGEDINGNGHNPDAGETCMFRAASKQLNLSSDWTCAWVVRSRG